MSEFTAVEDEARSLDDVIDVLKASATFDLAAVPGLHSLLDHGLQTAAVLRTTHPDDVELQIAGLVHDIGHILGPRRDEVHAEVAATFVMPVLGARIAGLVRLHVPAKRYLVTTDPLYQRELDVGSVISLERQGGVLAADEISDFENDRLAADALVLRRADEGGKVAGLAVPDLHTWLGALRSHNSQE